MFKMKKVDSSFIKSLGWARDMLFVALKNETVYVYNNVDYDTYSDMIKADSIGEFYNSTIKDLYSCTKLNGDLD